MPSPLSRPALTAVLLTALAASIATAGTLRVEFAGTVTSSPGLDAIAAGAPVSGWYEFDPDTRDSNAADPALGLYPAVSAARIEVDGHAYTADSGTLSVLNDGVVDPSRPQRVDAYGLNAGPPLQGDPLSGLAPFQLEFNLGDTRAAAFSDDHLPRSPDAGDFDVTSRGPTGTAGGRLHFRSAASGRNGVVHFRIDRLQPAP